MRDAAAAHARCIAPTTLRASDKTSAVEIIIIASRGAQPASLSPFRYLALSRGAGEWVDSLCADAAIAPCDLAPSVRWALETASLHALAKASGPNATIGELLTRYAPRDASQRGSTPAATVQAPQQPRTRPAETAPRYVLLNSLVPRHVTAAAAGARALSPTDDGKGGCDGNDNDADDDAEAIRRRRRRDAGAVWKVKVGGSASPRCYSVPTFVCEE